MIDWVHVAIGLGVFSIGMIIAIYIIIKVVGKTTKEEKILEVKK